MQPKFIYPTSPKGIPFFYIIEHTPVSKYYAGSKFTKSGNTTDSSIFMTEFGYQTSSDIIENIIKKEGLAAFKIRKIRHFETAEEALEYEVRFLKRVNAKDSLKWYNQTNGSKDFKFKGGIPRSKEVKAKISKANIGRKHSAETKAKISKAVKLNMTAESKAKHLKSKQCISIEVRAKMSKAKSGRKWFNNGSKTMMCFSGTEPHGYVVGRI